MAKSTYYYFIMNKIYSTPDCLLAIVLAVTLCLTVSFMFNNYLQHYFYPTLYSKLPDGDLLLKARIENKHVKIMKKKMDDLNDDMYSDRIKAAFKNVDQIDDIVQESTNF